MYSMGNGIMYILVQFDNLLTTTLGPSYQNHNTYTETENQVEVA